MNFHFVTSKFQVHARHFHTLFSPPMGDFQVIRTNYKNNSVSLINHQIEKNIVQSVSYLNQIVEAILTYEYFMRNVKLKILGVFI